MRSAAAHALADAIAEAAMRRAKEAPALPDAVPDDADADALSSLEADAEIQRRVAKMSGDFGAFAQMGRLLVQIQEHRRKIAPPPVADPNEAIDIRAAAERGKRIDFETLENIIANAELLA